MPSRERAVYLAYQTDWKSCALREQCLAKGAKGNRARRVSAVRRLLPPVLATCGIRRPELACESTSCGLLLLAYSREEEYNLKHASAHLYKGGMDTVQRILIFITRLTRFCLQSLHHRYVTWTTPGPTSLLGTLINLSRSKSELEAENALLRVPLIILRRQVNRAA